MKEKDALLSIQCPVFKTKIEQKKKKGLSHQPLLLFILEDAD